MSERIPDTDLYHVCKALSDELLKVSLRAEAIESGDLHSNLKLYKLVSALKQELTDSLKVVTGLYNSLSHEVLPKIMEDHKIDSVKAHGRNFVLSVSTRANISEDQRELGNAWVRDVAKCPHAIIPTVNPKSLASIVEGHFLATGQWPDPSAVKVYLQKHVAVRRK